MAAEVGLQSAPPPAMPTTAQLQAYLRLKGWHELPPGPAGSLWEKDAARIGIPHDNDNFLITGSIDRIASLERRNPKDVRNAVRFLLFDITHLRAAERPFNSGYYTTSGCCQDSFIVIGVCFKRPQPQPEQSALR